MDWGRWREREREREIVKVISLLLWDTPREKKQGLIVRFYDNHRPFLAHGRSPMISLPVGSSGGSGCLPSSTGCRWPGEKLAFSSRAFLKNPWLKTRSWSSGVHHKNRKLHGKINPKDWQVLSLADVGFLLFFTVVLGDYGKPCQVRFLVRFFLVFLVFVGLYVNQYFKFSLVFGIYYIQYPLEN